MFGTVDFSLNFNGLQVKHAPLQNLAKKKNFLQIGIGGEWAFICIEFN